MHARSLYRVMRVLAGVGVLEEREGRRFETGPLGALLRTDAPGSLRSLAILCDQDPHWRVWGHLLRSVRSGEQVFGGLQRVADRAQGRARAGGRGGL